MWVREVRAACPHLVDSQRFVDSRFRSFFFFCPPPMTGFAPYPGNASCPCLASLEPFGLRGGLLIRAANRTIDYGAAYGLGGCHMHDRGQAPYCSRSPCNEDASSSSSNGPVPEWCFDAWCWVNASECQLTSISLAEPQANASFELVDLHDPAHELHYSYATCGMTCPSATAVELNATTPRRQGSRPASGRQMPPEVLPTTIPSALMLLILLIGALWCFTRSRAQGKRLRTLEVGRLRYTRNMMPATVVSLVHPVKYHIFLSHVWGLGQDRMRVIKDRLAILVPDLRVFLDVDDLEEGGGAEDLVHASRVLVYLTAGYFSSPNCMREALWATVLRKDVVLLLETERAKGGITLDEAREHLSEAFHGRFDEWKLISELEAWITAHPAAAAMSHMPTFSEIECALLGPKGKAAKKLLGHKLEVYEWSALRPFQDVTLRKLAEPFVERPQRKNLMPRDSERGSSDSSIVAELSEATTVSDKIRTGGAKVRSSITSAMDSVNSSLRRESQRDSRASSPGEASFSRPIGLYVENDIERKPIKLHAPRHGKNYHVYCSRSNAGAQEILTELQEVRTLPKLKVARTSNLLEQCEQMLVYLNEDTWSTEFGEEVVHAMLHHIPLLLVHEQPGLGQEERKAVSFEAIIAATPRKLLRAQIYAKIAVPLKGGVLRRRSLAMLAEVLAAVREAKTQRWRLGSLSFRFSGIESSRNSGDEPLPGRSVAHPVQPPADIALPPESKSSGSNWAKLVTSSRQERLAKFSVEAIRMARDDKVWEQFGEGLAPAMPSTDASLTHGSSRRSLLAIAAPLTSVADQLTTLPGELKKAASMRSSSSRQLNVDVTQRPPVQVAKPSSATTDGSDDEENDDTAAAVHDQGRV